MQRIFKYEIEITGVQNISTHKGAIPIAFQIQNGVPCAWFRVNTDEPVVDYKLYVRGTGHEIEPWRKHIGTVQLNGFVWHLFYQPPHQ